METNRTPDIEGIDLIVRNVLGSRYINSGFGIAANDGDSFDALEVALLIQRKFNVSIDAAAILSCITLDDILHHLRSKTNLTKELLPQYEVTGTVPLSAQQNNIAMDHFKDSESLLYNLPMYVKLVDSLSPDVIEMCLQQLYDSQPTLRIQIVHSEEGLGQVVKHSDSISLERTVTKKSVKESFQLFIKPFDILNGSLWRAQFTETLDGNYLFFDAHHVICDGQTKTQIFLDLDDLLHDRAITESRFDFLKFVAWSRTHEALERRERQKKFWHGLNLQFYQRLALPIDHPRAPIRSRRGGYILATTDSQLTQTIRDIARDSGLTAYNILFGFYAIWLGGLCQSNKFITGSPASGRNFSGLAQTYGMFVNTVCVPVDLDRSQTIIKNCARQATASRAVFENQDYAYSDLVLDLGAATDASKTPIFDAFFAFHREALHRSSIAGERVRWMNESNGTSMFDMNFQVKDFGDHFEYLFLYNADLFDPTTAHALLEDHMTTIRSFVISPFISTIESLDASANGLTESTCDFSF